MVTWNVVYIGVSLAAFFFRGGRFHFDETGGPSLILQGYRILHKDPFTKLPLFFMGMVMGSKALIDHANFSARPDDAEVRKARLLMRIAADGLFFIFALAFLGLQLLSFFAFWEHMGLWIRLYVRSCADDTHSGYIDILSTVIESSDEMD